LRLAAVERHEAASWQWRKFHSQRTRHEGYNSKGYSLENSVPCCKECNHSKGDMTMDEWRTYMLRMSMAAIRLAHQIDSLPDHHAASFISRHAFLSSAN
jgi:endonuclease I